MIEKANNEKQKIYDLYNYYQNGEDGSFKWQKNKIDRMIWEIK